jgi:hypothetical protein
MFQARPDPNNSARIAVLFDEVYQKTADMLRNVSLIGAQDKVPSTPFLQAVRLMDEPYRTTLLKQFEHTSFPIATSEPVRVQWARRSYVFGPIPQSVPLGPALQALQHASTNRFLPADVPRRKSPMRHQPILVSWYGFFIDSDRNLADTNTPIQRIWEGPTFQALLVLHENNRANQEKETEMPNFSQFFENPASMGGPAFSTAPPPVPQGTNYNDHMRSIQGVGHRVLPTEFVDKRVTGEVGDPTMADQQEPVQQQQPQQQAPIQQPKPPQPKPPNM